MDKLKFALLLALFFVQRLRHLLRLRQSLQLGNGNGY